MKKLIILTVCLLVLTACEEVQNSFIKNEEEKPQPQFEEEVVFERVDFSEQDTIFRFSAEIPEEWEIEFVPGITSINIFNPEDPAASTRDKSQIFIRYFQAGEFLTLSTVDISKQSETVVNGHDAVEYEIAKKADIADFPEQPAWRNQTHQLTDIRFSSESPTIFYVFAYNPRLQREVVENFFDSLIFHNDYISLAEPLENSAKRVTKKPFGIRISPENSPVQPEKFSGYHTGTDFEVTESELDQEIPVFAICGGEIVLKKVAGGYGGVLVQNCLWGEEYVTVVYGHLSLASIQKNVGEYLKPGEHFAGLGSNYSDETDGERKHLHLSVHKGSAIDIRGYVNTEGELNNWLDPIHYLPTN